MDTPAPSTTPSVPDATPPTAPTGWTATANGDSRVDLAWNASTDDVGVTEYRVERCEGAGCTTTFAQIATPTGTSFSDTGLAASTTYRYRVRAADASGKLSAYSVIADATTGATPPTPTGLVGAWGFGEGGGNVTADASGNGNVGTVTNAAWTPAGRHGGALSFNGANSLVRVQASPSLNVGAALTVSAWIRPLAAQNWWKAIVQREVDAYFLHASSDAGPLRPAAGGTIGGSVPYITGPAANPVDAWTHLALTYDGSALRMYVNGTLASSRPTTGTVQSTSNPLSIGGNLPYGEYFQGLIDEVRVYNRALSQTDIQTDMNTAVGGQSAAATSVLSGTRLPSLLL